MRGRGGSDTRWFKVTRNASLGRSRLLRIGTRYIYLSKPRGPARPDVRGGRGNRRIRQHDFGREDHRTDRLLAGEHGVPPAVDDR